MIHTIGSVCSGIEAASVAWESFDVSFQWFSEIAEFQSKLLKQKYPFIPNVGDMNYIPEKIHNKEIIAPDLICGGTPCQAFSLAGNKNGLNDNRGNLTLKFVDIINESDKIRIQNNQPRTIVLWENVPGVLTDKTNAFGCFISLLSGLDNILTLSKYPSAGIVRGNTRNIAWRVLDARYFGLPQQRKRLYVVAGGKDFHPEYILFEKHTKKINNYPKFELLFEKGNHQFEIFREYSDCLYSAYGTKWNGNAAAYNGSLFVIQDGRLRRLSPLECERLMGFPDNYTNISGASKTNRYKAIGNSWAVPVIKWIGNRIINESYKNIDCDNSNEYFINMGNGIIDIGKQQINCTDKPEECILTSIKDIISVDVPESIYISPVGCHGILRRGEERKIPINPKLKEILQQTSTEISLDEIQKKSMVQKRGKYSQ